jgi:hypothetical protein
MASPRQLLLAAVRDCLQEILQADGYRTDAGQSVTLEPAPAAASERPDPFLAVVWERQERPDEPAIARTHRKTTFRVIGKLPAQMTDAQERIDAMASDVEQALDRRPSRWPATFSAPVFVSSEPLAGAVEAGYVGVALTYTSNIPIK